MILSKIYWFFKRLFWPVKMKENMKEVFMYDGWYDPPSDMHFLRIRARGYGYKNGISVRISPEQLQYLCEGVGTTKRPLDLVLYDEEK